MEITEYYTTGIAISQFFHGAKRLGLPARDILSGIAPDPDAILQPMAQVPLEYYEKFVLELALISGDEMLGLHIGEQVMPTLYGIIPTLALVADTMRDALETCIQYQSLISGNIGGYYHKPKGDGLIISGSMAIHNPVIRRHTVECSLSLIARMIRFIAGRPDMSARYICLEHEASSEEARHKIEQLALCPVRFGYGSYELEVGPEVLDIALNTHGDDSLQLAEALAKKQLQEQQQHQGIVSQIKWQAQDLMLTSSPRRETVADRLNISVRTLDRRLAEAGITWQQLLDALRSQLAHKYLTETDMTMQAIASRLGFADVRTFQRRFRHWAGMAPSEYRANSTARPDCRDLPLA